MPIIFGSPCVLRLKFLSHSMRLTMVCVCMSYIVPMSFRYRDNCVSGRDSVTSQNSLPSLYTARLTMESITAASISTRPVVFNTKTSYSLPSQRFMIPATWKRYQLSQLVNKALNLSKPIPFDFVVRGEVLRTTLEEWCAHNGIGGVRSLASIIVRWSD